MSRRRTYGSVSEHPERETIIDALRAGTSLRAIEQQFDISKSVLGRSKVQLGVIGPPSITREPRHAR